MLWFLLKMLLVEASGSAAASTQGDPEKGGCGCASVQVTDETECSKLIASDVNSTDTRIHACLSKPWMALIFIENPKSSNDDLESICVGSIITQKYILTAARCFCNNKISGGSCVWNDAVRGEKLPSGHFMYSGGTTGSRVNYSFYDFAHIVLPGPLNFRLQSALFAKMSLNSKMKLRVAAVTIHPDYVEGRREYSDIALVQLEKRINLTSEHLSPICLPTPGFEDTDILAKVSGWGTLFHKFRKKDAVGCFTSNEGPGQYQPCRSAIILKGEVRQGCLNTQPPVHLNEVCREIHTALPSTQSEYTTVTDGSGRSVCYPTSTHGWCGTCIANASKGSPGLCDQSENEFVDKAWYSSVSHDRGWGACDPTCALTSTNRWVNEFIKEIEVNVYSRQGCVDRTANQTDVNFRPMVDRELCAVKTQERLIHNYKKDGDNFTKTGETRRGLEGGSESCQADLGGALYVLDERRRPLLIGVASRATQCSSRSANVIYSRVQHYLEWIKSITGDWQCEKDE